MFNSLSTTTTTTTSTSPPFKFLLPLLILLLPSLFIPGTIGARYSILPVNVVIVEIYAEYPNADSDSGPLVDIYFHAVELRSFKDEPWDARAGYTDGIGGHRDFGQLTDVRAAFYNHGPQDTNCYFYREDGSLVIEDGAVNPKRSLPRLLSNVRGMACRTHASSSG